MSHTPSLYISFCMVASVIVITGCQPVPPVFTPPAAAYSSIDKFQEELATRVAGKINPGSIERDFLVVVSQGSFPVGTVLRPHTTIPIDYRACVPANQPLAFPADSLFPSYSLSKGLAIDVGLDSDVIQQLVDMGVNIEDTDAIFYSVKNAKYQTLDDTTLKKLSQDDDCRGLVSNKTVWLIRGYILGQRNFVTENEKANTLQGKVVKVGSFSINFGSGTSSVKIVDEGETEFLQIISEIQNTSSGAEVATPRATSINDRSRGRVYVQRDREDGSDNAEKIVSNLAKARFDVEKRIERIDSSRMPKRGQVRYFNDSDKGLAEAALRELQKQYQNANIIRIGLPAPKGQLEVWLPRVATRGTDK